MQINTIIMSAKIIRLYKDKKSLYDLVKYYLINWLCRTESSTICKKKRKEKREKILLICWGVCKQCKSLALNSLEAKEVPVQLNIIDVNINTLYVN